MLSRPFLRTLFWLGLSCGLPSISTAQTLYPVVSKVEIVFSLVTHYSSLSNRSIFYDSYGSPQGNTNYVVPHLVYEPVVTLYNPYNKPLTTSRSRVKIWDPPIGFSFKKNDAYLRDDFEAGNFHGLARFQIANESDVNARKTLTLIMSNLSPAGYPGASVTLKPGESRTFSAWVENHWTWGLETAYDLNSRVFFDWNSLQNLSNKDGRTSNTLGVEAVPTLLPYLSSPQAGLQTDGLSLSSGRPQASRYSFEIDRNWTGNWVAIKLDDTINVQAKVMRTNPGTGTTIDKADFQMDLLRGQTENSTSDRVKAFPMSIANIVLHGGQSEVSRTFRAGQLLQTPTDQTPGGKMPFASFTMIAKSSALRTNRFLTTPALPASNLYELHFSEATDFGNTLSGPSDAFTGGPEILSYSRVGDYLYIDFAGRANADGINPFKIRGNYSLEEGFWHDLAGSVTVMTDMAGSGIYKAVIDVGGRGPRYFVRIEE